MYIHEKTYDLDELARFNTHMHTNFSHCAADEMVAVDMIKAAEKAGLEIIAFTDHNYPDEKNALSAQKEELYRQIKEYPTRLKVLIGGEISSYDVGKFADDEESDNSLDWRLYTTNHFHQNYWVHPENKTPRGYCEHMLAIMDKVIDSGRADAFAHPFMAKYVKCFDDFRIVTRSFTDNEIGDLMQKSLSKEITWELNVPAIFDDPDFHKRYFGIGKEVGVIFNIGTDAHKLENIDTHRFLPELKRILL